MPFNIVRNNLVHMKVDAIVNAANNSLLGGGGVDGAIHQAAGPKLLEECRTLQGCETGEAKITKGYDLYAKYVIHTVGPVWHGGDQQEEVLLRNCFRNSLELALAYDLKSIAFPLISSGVYGYPKAAVLSVALSEFKRFLEEHEMNIYLVVFDRASFAATSRYSEDVRQYIDDAYALEHHIHRREVHRQFSMESCSSLESLLDRKEETFKERLLRLIDERGLKDSEVYHQANIDRKLFSKIRNSSDYQPSKSTAVAFIMALKLNHDQALDLLNSCGFTLSRSSKFDLIIQFCIERGIYDLYEVNQLLFEYDQKTIGV